MKLSLTVLGATSVAIMALAGCQTVPYQGQAREVKKRPQDGGTVALKLDHRDEDRTKADEKMKSTCSPYPVQVLEEGEVSVGQETTASGSETQRASTERKAKLFGMAFNTGEAAGKNTSSSTKTTDIKEWQITYKCERKASARR
jgi:hypothetical protein